jgi:hypothetical protein
VKLGPSSGLDLESRRPILVLKAEGPEMFGFIMRTLVVAAIGGAVGWFLADVLGEDLYRPAMVLTGVAAAIAGSWVGKILRR